MEALAVASGCAFPPERAKARGFAAKHPIATLALAALCCFAAVKLTLLFLRWTAP